MNRFFPFLSLLIAVLPLGWVPAAAAPASRPQLELPNPLSVQSQGTRGTVRISWRADKQTGYPERIERITFESPSFKRTIPKDLFTDLRHPTLMFLCALYADPKVPDHFYLIVGGGEGGSTYEALFLISPERVARLGPPYRIPE